MHYPGNVVYMAGERDCWGLLKGEVRQMQNRAGELLWERAGAQYQIEAAKSLAGLADKGFWNCTLEWKPCNRVGEGKARELDAARSCAVWPDATDEDLTAPGLEQRLADRLPALMAEFKAAVESLGFTY